MVSWQDVSGAEEEEEGFEWGNKGHLVFMIIGLILFLVFFTGRIGTFVIDQAWFIAILFTSMGFSSTGFWMFLKIKSPVAIYNDGFTTFNPNAFHSIGNYGIIYKGGLYAWWVYTRGSSGVLVFPLDSIQKAGKCAHLRVKMEKVELDELPLEIREDFIKRKIKGPYEIGWADVEQYETVVEDKENITKMGAGQPSVGYLIDELKKSHKQTAMRERMMAGDLETYEKQMAGLKRVEERIGKKESLAEKVKRTIKEQ